MSAIETSKLTKVFGKLRAVDGIDLAVNQGEIFGLLGPNGAGKTTFIKMLSTTLKITSGSARVSGFNVQEDPDNVRKSIGIVFQEPAVDIELTGRENLDFHARMYGMNRRDRGKRIASVLKLVELEDKADALLKTYSGGMKRRLEIARGLMHHPRVLFLDEPTLGLDAQTRRVIWEHIRKINREFGITIILTTHYMEEADYLCSRVSIMDQGKILASGSPGQLRSSIGADIVSVKTPGPKKLESGLKKFKWVEKTKIHDSHISISLKNGETRIPQIIRTAETLKLKVESVELHKPTLEDVFIHFTGRKIRDEEDSKYMMRTMARMHGRGGH